jgi:hypothetical protein
MRTVASKAAAGCRTPKAVAYLHHYQRRGSILDCASPLALLPLAANNNPLPRLTTPLPRVRLAHCDFAAKS